MGDQIADLPVMEFVSAKAWGAWLAQHHDSSAGIWLKVAKKGTGVVTVTMPEAIEIALCYGWIDGLRHKHDDVYFRQRMTPRQSRSRWSQINRDKAEALVEAGRMPPRSAVRKTKSPPARRSAAKGKAARRKRTRS